MNATEKMKAKPINEQKKEQKFLFQFINHEDGSRSKPFVSNWDKLTEVLKERENLELRDDDLLLLVAILDGEKTTIPATPIIKVKTFMAFSDDKNSLNEETQNG